VIAPHPETRNPTGLDAYTPAQMAARVADAGVGKVHLPALSTLMLALMGGAFIAFGGMFYTLVLTGSGLGFGPSRLVGGVAFSLGLILVIVGGAELFTGNALIVMAWASRRISTAALLRNWALVFLGNFAGAEVRQSSFTCRERLDSMADPWARSARRSRKPRSRCRQTRLLFGECCATLLSAWRYGCASPPETRVARYSPSSGRSQRSSLSGLNIPWRICT